MLTILTPTYNRSHTLSRLFDSLCGQSNYDFEWLIIDDGSTDETSLLLQSFKNTAPFTIRIVYQENSGKHVAINTGVVAAAGDWIFIVDSDDALTPCAVKQINESLSTIDNNKTVGICFRRAYFDNKIVGKTEGLYGDVVKLHPTEAGHLLKGDLAYIFKTETMMKFPFPVFNGEKFVPELYVWNKIGDVGDVYFYVNKSIYLCEYLADGYTQNFKANLRKNPRGFLVFYKSQIFREVSLIRKVKCIIRTVQCFLFFLMIEFR